MAKYTNTNSWYCFVFIRLLFLFRWFLWRI